MKAIVAEEYGGPEVLKLEEVADPQTGPNGVLVRIHATSVNPVDWKLRRGMLRALWNLRFPVIWGADCSGVVEQVGEAVTLLQPGDQVYGFKDGRVARTYRGTYAEYAVLPEKCLARKPATLTHEQAAAVPLACLTAWQGLLQAGKLRPGQRVLIHAAAGGVGSFAIQIAKSFGAYVAATAGTRNQDFLRELGADLTLDYTRDRIEDRISGYDLVLDGVGRSTWAASLKALRRGGRLVTLLPPAPEDEGSRLKFLAKTAAALLQSWTAAFLQGKRLLMVRVQPRGGELDKITALIEAGKIRPVIQQTFPLEQIQQAHHLSEQGHVRGKIVLRIPGL